MPPAEAIDASSSVVVVAPEVDAPPESARGRGRPRNPELESRALRAALEVFGAKGWTGFTVDEVATRARVGKSSLYLRWPDRQALLAAALRSVQLEGGNEPDALPDPSGAAPQSEATLRDYLVAHARRRASLYLGEHGLAMLRLYADARANPEIFSQVREEAITQFVHHERRRVQDAIENGDLPASASAVRILDAVEGAIFMHILVTPPVLVARVRAGIEDYIDAMVDDQLRAAGFTPRAG